MGVDKLPPLCYIKCMEIKQTTMKDFTITLHEQGTDAVAQMTLRMVDAVQAMNRARRCMGKGWFVVTLIEA